LTVIPQDRGGTVLPAVEEGSFVPIFYHAYMLFSYIVSALLLVYLVYRYWLAQKSKPTLGKMDIVYEEWFASGHSEANILTIMGGGRNCVRLIVTSEYLIVTSWLPFALFSGFYDMEHVVPLKAISTLVPKRLLGVEYLLLTYQDSQNRVHRIGLTPRNPIGFLAAIGSKASLTV
jgi:hypothetical protein